ncbi:MAG: hypothetical protein GC129_05055 [Proteobacteria bacterium]|nr:hypothetical protein [Pseudomonadota bacterium]
MQRCFILIGGAPTTGKSVMARALAARLGLPWISTDQLRSVAKRYGSKDRYPCLYDSAGLTAEEFLTRYTPQQVCDMEFKQGGDVWPAVEALLAHDAWEKGGIIEGVNILPQLVAENKVNPGLVRAVFLVDLDEERMRKVVYTRGLYDDAANYADDVKESEVGWAMMFARRLQAEAREYGLPCVQVGKTGADVDEVLRVLNLG